MPSISETFAERRREGRATLVPYVTSGFPSRSATVDVLTGLVEAGGDVLELGIPFSDPLADGPTIQDSTFRALEGGMTVEGTLEVLAEFRRGSDAAIVLFSYLNPLLQYGLEAFLVDAEGAGAQGLLLTDVPTGADSEVEGAILDSALDLIRLVSPTTRPDRASAIADRKVARKATAPSRPASSKAWISALPTITPSATALTKAACSGVEIPKPTATGSSTASRRALTSSSRCSAKDSLAPVTPVLAI